MINFDRSEIAVAIVTADDVEKSAMSNNTRVASAKRHVTDTSPGIRFRVVSFDGFTDERAVVTAAGREIRRIVRHVENDTRDSQNWRNQNNREI